MKYIMVSRAFYEALRAITHKRVYRSKGKRSGKRVKWVLRS